MSINRLPSELKLVLFEEAAAISPETLIALASTSQALYATFRTLYKARLYRSILEETCGSFYKWPLAISLLLGALYPDNEFGNDDGAKKCLKPEDARALVERVLQPDIEQKLTPFHLSTARNIHRKCQEIACRNTNRDWVVWQEELEPALWLEEAQMIYFWTALRFCEDHWSAHGALDDSLVRALYALLGTAETPVGLRDLNDCKDWYYFMNWRHSLQDDPTYLFFFHNSDSSIQGRILGREGFTPSLLFRMTFAGLKPGSNAKRMVDECLEECICESLADVLAPVLGSNGRVLFHHIERETGKYTVMIRDRGVKRGLRDRALVDLFGSYGYRRDEVEVRSS